MPINSGIIKKDATGITVVGGTDQTFTSDGATVVNGIHVVDAAQADYRIRANASFTVKQPSYDANTGVYSKDKKKVILIQPKILASGKTVFNLIRIEREVHPESTAAEAVDLNRKGAQLLSDADFDNYWTAGSLA